MTLYVYTYINGAKGKKFPGVQIIMKDMYIKILVAMDKYNFFQNVYEVAKLIPRGKVTSYGAIAAYLGAKSSARMVGWAMNGAGSDPEVPAHRVVNHKGLLTGKHHFEHPNRMQELLESEGINVRSDQVVDFETHFWDPMKELL